MALEDGLDFLNGDLPSIINRVNALREGFATMRTLVALIAFTRSVVLVGFRVVTVETSHGASPDSSDANDESHVCLVHDRLRERIAKLTKIGQQGNVGMLQRVD
jgi:hypothetical protein